MAKKVGALHLSRMHTEEDFGFMKLAHGETANLPTLTTEEDDSGDIPELITGSDATAETPAGAVVLVFRGWRIGVRHDMLFKGHALSIT